MSSGNRTVERNIGDKRASAQFDSGKSMQTDAKSIQEVLQELKLSNKGLFPDKSDLICLSHLRWNFVYQRPQHLLSRCAKERRVFFIEEPIFGADTSYRLDINIQECGISVVVPHLQEGLSQEEIEMTLKEILNHLLEQAQISEYILWYYTPMALGFTDHLNPLVTVYD